MIYPYEQTAINGGGLPDGLSFVDQYMFLGLRNMYAALRNGVIDREQGKREKKKLEYQYSTALADQQLIQYTHNMWARIEAAGSAYRRERSLERADEFIAAVYGVYSTRPAAEEEEQQ